MMCMSQSTEQDDAIRAIIKIISDQKTLEKHQRAKRASVETLQDSMVYAYDAIIKVVEPFMDDSVRGVIRAAFNARQ